MLDFKTHVIHGAIFDMDGTMFDTERLRLDTLQQASKELTGVEFSHDYLMQCLGLSAKSAEQLAQQQYGADIPYALIRKRADELELEYVRQYGVPVKAGLVQVLERLRKSGLKMAVATSSRRAIAEEYLINANVYKFFDVLVCGDEVQRGKPHPEIFLNAAEKINLSPKQCLMFEDSDNGLKSASAAGGITILFQDLKVSTAEMLARADYFYMDVLSYLKDLDRCVPILPMPELHTPFPQTLNQHQVAIHGFGAIGGGYLAQVLSHWDGYTRPHKIFASTRNRLYQSTVNAFGSYCIRYGQHSYDERIDHIQIVDAQDQAQMHDMYIQSSLVAICLPEAALLEDMPTIASALYARFNHYADEEQGLTLLIILNKVGAKALFTQALRQALLEITSEQITSEILNRHFICDTVVNRMVSKLSEQKLYRQLRIKYNIFKQQQAEEENIQVDLDDATALSREQEHQAGLYVADLQKNFQPSHSLQHIDLILFQAETDMPLYVENNSPLLKKMRQMHLVDDISQIQLIKNRLWNGVHAMLAWYAMLRGHQNIGVALADEQVKRFMLQLLAQVQQGLRQAMPQHGQELSRLSQSFIDSCAHAYQDPCARVGRDPLRKLEANERVFGSIACQLHYGLAYDVLLKGAVLGYVYAIEQGECDDVEALLHLQMQVKQLLPEQQRYSRLYDVIAEHIEALIQQDMSIQQFMQHDFQRQLI